MTSNKINVGLRVAKVRCSQILEDSMHCLTVAKEEKKEKGNSGIMFLQYHKVMSCV